MLMHLDQILSHFEKIEFFVIFTCGTSQYRPCRIFFGYRNFYMTLEIGLVNSKVFPIQKGWGYLVEIVAITIFMWFEEGMPKSL